MKKDFIMTIWKKGLWLLPALLMSVSLPAYADDDDDDDRLRPARVQYDNDDDDDDDRRRSRNRATQQNSCSRAANIALRRIGGRVTDVDAKTRNGRRVCEVDVRARNGVKYEVLVDARSGRVIRSRRDRDD